MVQLTDNNGREACTSIPNITILELFTIKSTKTKHKYING